MCHASDMELLREYARQDSESAFAELVRRHVNLVYSAALRHVGMASHAEEITQAVFVILAGKAATLRQDLVLEGWLFETTRLTALSLLRGERRRQFREQEAYMQSVLQDSTPDPVWQQLAPLLDEAMMRLDRREREAVVLRFFKGRSLGEIAAALNLKVPAVQKRVDRALEKLHRYFNRRGVSSTTDIIAGTISSYSVQAAPVALAKTVTAVALAKGAAVPISTLTLVKGALEIMAWTKAKTAIVAGVAVLLAVGTTTVTVKEIQEHRTYPWQVEHFNTGMLNREPPQVRIIPTKFPQSIGWGEDNGKFFGIGEPVEGILKAIYGIPSSSVRVVLPTGLPREKYDFIANLPYGSKEALQRELRKKFGVIGRLETRDVSVLLLKVNYPNAHGLKLSRTPDGTVQKQAGHYYCVNRQLASLAKYLELYFQIPVVDQTGLTGSYDIDLTWDERDNADANHDALKQAVLGQLGLELVPGTAPIEMLVVDKVK